MKHSARFVVLLAVLAAVVFSGAQSAFAATLAVPVGYPTIQSAIDAAVSGDVINVSPGAYNETAANSSYNGGIYQFGLFFSASKSGITLQGVKADGTPVTERADVVARITTNATNNFGFAGTMVAGNDITIRGLDFGDNVGGYDKAIEVVGDGFTLEDSKVGDGGLYIGDANYNENGTPGVFTDDTSSIMSYTISGCGFSAVGGVYIANGAGWDGSAPASTIGRSITGNVFDGLNTLSFAGLTPGSGWLNYPTGAATVTGNTFTDPTNARYIQSWGVVQAEFPYESYWNENTFPKKVITTTDGDPNHVRGYDTGAFLNLKRIGTIIQPRITYAQPGDTVLVGPGTYVESGQIVVDKDLTIVGTDEDTTIIKPAQGTTGSWTEDSSAWILVNPDVTFNLSDVTLDGAGQLICNAIVSRGHGVIDDNTIKNIAFNQSGPDYSGCAVALYASDMTVSDNEFSGIGREGVFASTLSAVTITGNTYAGKGAGNWLDYAFEVGHNSTAIISGNTVSGNLGVAEVDGSKSAGLMVSSYYDVAEEAVSGATITGNRITDNTDGILVGYDEADRSVVQAHNNIIAGNIITGATNTSALNMFDATDNYWGAASGPKNPVTNVLGTGNAVSENVTYMPFLTVGTALSVPEDYATIQEAVDAATSGDTIEIAAGEYAENLLLNKSVTLLGPNAGKAWNDPTRVAEAIIVPAVNDTAAGKLITLSANGVRIDGLTLDGDSPVLTGGLALNGADINAYAAVQNSGNANHFVFENNVVKNVKNGITFAMTNGTINTFNTARFNHFANIDNSGIYLQNDVEMTIESNSFEFLARGIGYHENWKNDPAFSPRIANNTIALAPTNRVGLQSGIWVNNRWGDASPLTIESNTITVSSAITNLADGIRFTSIAVPSVTVRNNTIAGNFNNGYYVWNVAGPILTISGGSVTGVKGSGVLLTNSDAAFGAAGFGGSFAAVDDVAIAVEPSGAGMRALSTGVTPSQIAAQGGTTVSGAGATGAVVDGATARIVFVGDSAASFDAELANYITLANAGATNPATEINATKVEFAGKLGSAMDLTEASVTEDKIVHKVDNATLGLVRVKASNLYVTATSGSLQAAVKAATAGDTIYVAAGTYVEVGQIVIDKDLTIIGADEDTTILKPAQATATGSQADSSAWILVKPGVTFNLSDVTLDGAGRKIGYGILTHGHGTIADNIIKNMVWSNRVGMAVGMWGSDATVSDNDISGVGRIGVHVGYFSAATILDNTFVGKGAGDWLDYGVEVGRDSTAVITGNTISGNTGKALSDGSTSAGILVTSYFHTGATHSSATITGNTITGNTYGIVVGYDTADTSVVHAHDNTITGNVFGAQHTSALGVGVFDATNNWWGSTDAAAVAAMMSGPVTYKPFLYEAAGPGTSSLSGTLTNGGAPLNRVVVGVYDATTHTFIKSASTNPSGAYLITGLRAGLYHVRFTNTTPASLTQWNDHKASMDAAADIFVASGASVTLNSDLAAQVPVTTQSITGTITNAGTPLNRVIVTAFNATTHAQVKGVFTDSLGKYTLSLPAGSYHLRFTGTTPASLSQWNDHKSTMDAAAIIVVAPGASVTLNSDLAAQVPVTTQSITGTITNAGTPLNRVIVTAYDEATYAYVKGVYTNALGNYALTLPAGTYVLRVTGLPVGLTSRYYLNSASISGAQILPLLAGSTSALGAWDVSVPID